MKIFLLLSVIGCELFLQAKKIRCHKINIKPVTRNIIYPLSNTTTFNPLTTNQPISLINQTTSVTNFKSIGPQSEAQTSNQGKSSKLTPTRFRTVSDLPSEILIQPSKLLQDDSSNVTLQSLYKEKSSKLTQTQSIKVSNLPPLIVIQPSKLFENESSQVTEIQVEESEMIHELSSGSSKPSPISNVNQETTSNLTESSRNLQQYQRIAENISLIIIILGFILTLNILIFVFGFVSMVYYVFCVVIDFALLGLPHYWLLSSSHILQFVNRKYDQAKLQCGIF